MKKRIVLKVLITISLLLPCLIYRASASETDTSEPKKAFSNSFCKKCNRKFAGARDLRRDQWRHQGRKFICDICSKAYSGDYLLKPHLKNIHGTEGFGCLTCYEVFSSDENLNKHMTTHHIEFRCLFFNDECKETFRSKALLRNHLINKHAAHRYDVDVQESKELQVSDLHTDNSQEDDSHVSESNIPQLVRDCTPRASMHPLPSFLNIYKKWTGTDIRTEVAQRRPENRSEIPDGISFPEAPTSAPRQYPTLPPAARLAASGSSKFMRQDEWSRVKKARATEAQAQTQEIRTETQASRKRKRPDIETAPTNLLPSFLETYKARNGIDIRTEIALRRSENGSNIPNSISSPKAPVLLPDLIDLTQE